MADDIGTILFFDLSAESILKKLFVLYATTTNIPATVLITCVDTSFASEVPAFSVVAEKTIAIPG